MIVNYKQHIIRHYEVFWSNKASIKKLFKGPIHELPPEFCVLEFPPSKKRNMWTYATCCMSIQDNDNKIELHLFAPEQNQSVVELLTIIAHYHITGRKLGLWHTINFGRGWLHNSNCDYGLISLPYLDGPELEKHTIQGQKIKFLWLIPITKDERNFKKKKGIEALENLFEESNINYLDPYRNSIV